MPTLTGPWYMKRGALGPPYRVTLRQADKRALDLSPASGVDRVEFVMRHKRATVPTVEAQCSIVQTGDALTGLDVGVCRYDWQPGDTDQSGIYRAEFALYDAQGNELARVPNDSYQEIVILGNLSEFFGYDGRSNGADVLSALPKQVNLVLYRGDPFSMTITVTAAGEPVDLGEAAARAQIRRSAASEEVLGEFEVTTAHNVILLYLSGSVTAALPPACVWDCELAPDGTTVAAGRIRVLPQVTRD